MPITGRHDVRPCFKWTFLKIGGHLTSRFDADQKMSLCENSTAISMSLNDASPRTKLPKTCILRTQVNRSAHLGRGLSNAQMSGLGGEAEIDHSITGFDEAAVEQPRLRTRVPVRIADFLVLSDLRQKIIYQSIEYRSTLEIDRVPAIWHLLHSCVRH